MRFEENLIYHVFNQGNNREEVFFQDSHYRVFEEKMRIHLKPYCHLFAYCLMPNHFHWLIKPKPEGVKLHPISNRPNTSSVQHLSKSIGVVLGSYARYINVQHGWTGSRFKQKTRVKDGLIKSLFELPKETIKRKGISNQDYAKICLNYIHQNPIKGQFPLAAHPTEWEFSSACAWEGLPNNGLCDVKLGKKLIFGS